MNWSLISTQGVQEQKVMQASSPCHQSQALEHGLLLDPSHICNLAMLGHPFKDADIDRAWLSVALSSVARFVQGSLRLTCQCLLHLPALLWDSKLLLPRQCQLQQLQSCPGLQICLGHIKRGHTVRGKRWKYSGASFPYQWPTSWPSFVLGLNTLHFNLCLGQKAFHAFQILGAWH